MRNLISNENNDSDSDYDFITQNPSLRELFDKALSFFIVETVVYDEKSKSWYICGKEKILANINSKNYNDLRKNILICNSINISEIESNLKFKNKRAKEIYQQMQKGRKNLNKSKSLPSLWVLISALCAKSKTYNLLNVWDLTIYQFYDQFSRLNINYAEDVNALKWAAWGTESFDYSKWYQELNNGQEDS